MSQAALHVCREKVQRLLAKMKVYGKSKFHFLNSNPQDFLQEIVILYFIT